MSAWRRSLATRSSTPRRGDVVAFVQSFAGGAILTMLADTMMPEGFEYGGKGVGVLTTLGFIFAYGLHVAV